MTLWLLLAAAFVAQEPVTASALLLAATQQGYDVWLIHALFFSATLFDAAAGYGLGYVLHKRFGHTRISCWLVRRAKGFDKLVGRHSKRLILLLWGPMVFPYSAIMAPWFGYTFAENLWLSLIGDTVLWYGSLWLVVLGVRTFIPNPLWAIFIVAALMLTVVLALNIIAARNERR